MTTNYVNTFISVAADCPVETPETPPTAARPTVAALQFELVSKNPYGMTSDEVLFAVHVRRADIADADIDAERERFWAKDHACFRASPLSKRYGWGTHHDEHGRVALYGVGTAEYERLSSREDITQKAAMRSRRD